jgi:hypothetical protein
MTDSKPIESNKHVKDAAASPVPDSADVAEARTASAGDVKTVEAQRTSASDGSLRKYSAAHIDELEQSIELVNGSDVIAKRGSNLPEAARSKIPGPYIAQRDLPQSPGTSFIDLGHQIAALPGQGSKPVLNNIDRMSESVHWER